MIHQCIICSIYCVWLQIPSFILVFGNSWAELGYEGASYMEFGWQIFSHKFGNSDKVMKILG